MESVNPLVWRVQNIPSPWREHWHTFPPVSDSSNPGWFGSTGRGVEPIPAPPRAYSGLALSRDGKQVAVNITSDTQQLWTYDLARDTLTHLASGQASGISPVWTPDGKRVAYRSNRGGG